MTFAMRKFDTCSCVPSLLFLVAGSSFGDFSAQKKPMPPTETKKYRDLEIKFVKDTLLKCDDANLKVSGFGTAPEDL